MAKFTEVDLDISDSEIDKIINSLSEEEIMNIFYIDWSSKDESMA